MISRRIFFVSILFLLFKSLLYAEGKDIIDLAAKHYSNGEYYSAVTELLRYQYLYPKGALYPESLLILGKAYFKGNNYNMAVYSMYTCYSDFMNASVGEEALYLLGSMKLLQGSPYFALRNLKEYKASYKNGKYIEETDLNICYASVLINDLKSLNIFIAKYRKNYPEGRYLAELNNLEALVLEEVNRTRKSVWVSVLGSILIPGFGHFYTGNFKLGMLTLFTNALLGFLIYNGYRNDSTFQMILFSVIELSFYQYSIIGGIRSYPWGTIRRPYSGIAYQSPSYFDRND